MTGGSASCFGGQYRDLLLYLHHKLDENNSNQQVNTAVQQYIQCVCMCFLPIHSGHQVRWTYQPGSHRRKVPQDFSSTFFLRCVP